MEQKLQRLYEYTLRAPRLTEDDYAHTASLVGELIDAGDETIVGLVMKYVEIIDIKTKNDSSNESLWHG